MIHLTTGGGAALRYTVQAATAMPTVAGTENDIVVITNTAIGDVQINCASAPTAKSDGTALAAGDIYFELLPSSDATFNAIESGALYVPLGACYQYDGSVWAPVTAYVYHAGAWVEHWDGHVYLRGNEYTGITGGWLSCSNCPVKHLDSVLRIESNMSIAWCVTQTTKPIDFTDFKTLVISEMVKVSGSNSSYGGYLGYSKTRMSGNSYCSNYGGTQSTIAYVDINAQYAKAIDITNVIGLYYPTACFYNGAVVDVGSIQLLR